MIILLQKIINESRDHSSSYTVSYDHELCVQHYYAKYPWTKACQYSSDIMNSLLNLVLSVC